MVETIGTFGHNILANCHEIVTGSSRKTDSGENSNSDKPDKVSEPDDPEEVESTTHHPAPNRVHQENMHPPDTLRRQICGAAATLYTSVTGNEQPTMRRTYSQDVSTLII